MAQLRRNGAHLLTVPWVPKPIGFSPGSVTRRAGGFKQSTVSVPSCKPDGPLSFALVLQGRARGKAEAKGKAEQLGGRSALFSLCVKVARLLVSGAIVAHEPVPRPTTIKMARNGRTGRGAEAARQHTGG